VADYPSLAEMSRLATEDYSKIDSIDQIRPPYPAHGTPNWWALRRRYEQLLLARVRRERKDAPLAGPTALAKVVGADFDQDRHCRAATWASLGNERAVVDYQRAGRSREWWLSHWNPAAAAVAGRAA